MVNIPTQLTPGLGGIPAWLIPLALLVVALLLIFAGRTIVKVIAFLVVGLIGASIGEMLASGYLAGTGALGQLLGILGGFLIGGIIGVAIVAFGIGLAVGYGAYLLALDLFGSHTAALVVGFVFFIIGLALYGKILTLVTALAGGLLLFHVLLTFGFGPTLATLFAAATTIIGIAVEYGMTRRPKPAAPSAGGGASAPG
ncbi:MAG: hypothetical protein HY247_06615 [archaeon]|nr:MAG: hypothetical protein HY247_06615 [archaeon]